MGTCGAVFAIESTLTRGDISRADALLLKNGRTSGQLDIAEAHQVGLRVLEVLVAECLNPFLAKRERSGQQRILLALHYRVHGFIKSLLNLTSVSHFQTVGAIARSVIELVVDMELLSRGKVEHGYEKIDAFTAAQRLSACRKTVAFYTARPDIGYTPAREMQEFIDAEGDDIDRRTAALWGTDRNGKARMPGHWSGIDIKQRGELLGLEYERLVIDGYDQRNWVVHTGLSSVAGVETPALIAFCAVSVRAVHTATLNAIRMMALAFDAESALDGFSPKCDEAQTVPFLVVYDRQLTRAGEPQRVRIMFQGRDK